MAKETEETSGPRSQMWKHEGMVEWINETEGVNLDNMSAAEVIAYAFAKRVDWRQSDTYKELVASHAAEAEEAKAERTAARKAAAAEKKAAEKSAPAKKAPAKKAAASKKAPAKKAPAKKAPAKRASKSAGNEDPFA